ncbi:DNA-binding response regulator [Saccharobesus litoralis]|uniref:DNA-binding response regulator n=1 Tax=Saccharobesus litoralis TaxID=2172099 RepID=A0A2S0VS35_9ALTE|nr:response regulator transcription factor [Saccharobesus litoralis]AWB67031.1 DNA-binding response regulator [Saccharobesus litoralis]
MTTSTIKVWLIDDDERLTELLTEYLSANDYNVQSFNSGQPLLNALSSGQRSDIMVLDIMMPGLSGLQLLPAIRSHTDTPVIMLTGRGDEIDRIIGLEMGADDYVAKPCNPRELMARIQAVVRRHKATPEPAATHNKIDLHGIKLDLGMLTCHFLDTPIEFTGIEFSVLAELMKNAGQLLSKEILTEKILHRKLTAYDRSIDVHVSRVRQKLKQAGFDKDIIKTVRGQGYQCVT